MDLRKIIQRCRSIGGFEVCSYAYLTRRSGNVLFKLKPGMTEYEAVTAIAASMECQIPGAFDTISGERTRWVLAVRSSKRPFNTAISVYDGFWFVWCVECLRAGFVVRVTRFDLPEAIRDYVVDTWFAPYFRAVVDWYELVGISCNRRRIAELFTGVWRCLSRLLITRPGHLIHIDEWASLYIKIPQSPSIGHGCRVDVDSCHRHTILYEQWPGAVLRWLIEDFARLAEHYPRHWLKLFYKTASFVRVVPAET